MDAKMLREKVGKEQSLQLIETDGFESLTKESAFIKREVSVLFEDGAKAALADVEYVSFENNEDGRRLLEDSDIDQTMKDAILLVWGKE